MSRAEKQAGHHQKQAAIPEQLFEVLTTFIEAETWAESQAYLEQHPELLSDEAATQIDNLIQVVQAEGREDILFNLETHAELLARCRQEGIEAAFQHQQVIQLLQQSKQLYEQSQYEPALALARQAVDFTRQTLGESHPDLIVSLNNLAALYEALGDQAQADLLYQQVLELGRTVLGERHPEFAFYLNDIARVYGLRGDYPRAEPLFRQAVEINCSILGEQHPDFAQSLNDLGRLYKLMGNHAQAEPLYRQALDIRRAALGEHHLDFMQTLNNLVELYLASGDYTQAEQCARQVVDIRRGTIGERHPDFVISLNVLAFVYQLQNDYDQAEPLYRHALEIQGETLGQFHPDFIESLKNLAEFCISRSNFSQARLFYQQLLEIQRATLGERHSDFVSSLSNLANMQAELGDYGQAEALYQQALELQSQVWDEADELITLNNLGYLYYQMGDFSRAEQRLNQALEMARQVVGEAHPHFAASLNYLAEVYEARGDYRRAEAFYRRALEIRRAALGEADAHVATSFNNLAGLYAMMGDYERAETLHLQALAIRRQVLGEKHPHYAISLNNLAELYGTMGDYERAELFHRQALAIKRRARGERHPDVALSLSNLGKLYVRQGDYDQAKLLYQQALEIMRAARGETHPDVAVSLTNLAQLHAVLGDYERAEPLLWQSLEIKRTTLGERHPFFALGLDNLAGLLCATNRATEAFPLVVQALAIQDQLIGQIFSIGSERQRLAYLQTWQGENDSYLSLIYDYLAHDPIAIQTGLNLLLRHKVIGAEAGAVQRDALLGGRYPHLAPMLAELTHLRQQLAQKSLAGPGPAESAEVHQQLLAQWQAQKEQLEVELAQQIPEMNLDQKLQAANLPTVAQVLPPGSVLIEFVRFNLFDFKAIPARGEPRWQPARYLAFVLPAAAPDRVQMIDLGLAEPIDRLVAAYRATFTGEADQRALVYDDAESSTSSAERELGRELRAAVFDPLLPTLGDCRRLFLSPDGDLTRLSFEILPLAAENRRLIDTYQISYLSTGRDVLRFEAASIGQPAAPVVIADPDFDWVDRQRVGGSHQVPASRSESSPVNSQHSRDLSRSGLHFGRLPGTRREGEQIAAMLGVSPLLAEQALESRLKASRSPLILHLATHGFFLPNQQLVPDDERIGTEAMGRAAGARLGWLAHSLENPMLRSGLALAGVNPWLKNEPLPPEVEDGLLNAEDVTCLDLLATELVVLSACETGLGEVQVGEGVFGLRRAFVLAGAQTLVMSLWKVPDQQTQQLMTDFYRRILAGESRAEALRQAQLALKEKYPHPLYWGAFICQGEPGPLPPYQILRQ